LDTLDPVLRQHHAPGEALFVDWAGQTIPVLDPNTGEERRASLFVATLGFSNFLYAEAFFDQKVGSWISAHIHAYRRGGFTTVEKHRPKSHQNHLNWTPQRMIDWAATIGPATGEVVACILKNKPHPEQGYRSCLGLIRLAKAAGPERMENACRRALHYELCSYSMTSWRCPRHVRIMAAVGLGYRWWKWVE
jgi:transposase